MFHNQLSTIYLIQLVTKFQKANSIFLLLVRLHDSIQEESFHYLVFDLWAKIH